MENVNNIMIEHLKALRAGQDNMLYEIKEIKTRLTSVEQGQATIIQHLGHMTGDIADQHSRYDKLVERIEKIEKRLELAD